MLDLHRPLVSRLRGRSVLLGAFALLVGLSCREVTGPEDSAVALTMGSGRSFS